MASAAGGVFPPLPSENFDIRDAVEVSCSKTASLCFWKRLSEIYAEMWRLEYKQRCFSFSCWVMQDLRAKFLQKGVSWRLLQLANVIKRQKPFLSYAWCLLIMIFNWKRCSFWFLAPNNTAVLLQWLPLGKSFRMPAKRPARLLPHLGSC